MLPSWHYQQRETLKQKEKKMRDWIEKGIIVKCSHGKNKQHKQLIFLFWTTKTIDHVEKIRLIIFGSGALSDDAVVSFTTAIAALLLLWFDIYFTICFIPFPLLFWSRLSSLLIVAVACGVIRSATIVI